MKNLFKVFLLISALFFSSISYFGFSAKQVAAQRTGGIFDKKKKITQCPPPYENYNDEKCTGSGSICFYHLHCPKIK